MSEAFAAGTWSNNGNLDPAASWTNSQEDLSATAEASSWPAAAVSAPAFGDSSSMAAYMNSAVSNHSTGMSAGSGYGVWNSATNSWQKNKAPWSQDETSAAPQPPVAQPPSQQPTQPSAASLAAASSQAQAAAQARTSAAAALWAHQYAASMIAAQQQYGGASGWPQQTPPWPESGASSWPGWNDNSSWPPAANPAAAAVRNVVPNAEATWREYSQAAAAAAAMPEADQSQSVPSGTNAVSASTPKEEPPKQPTADEGTVSAAPVPEGDDEALGKDISSAVAQFLAGDGFAESESDEEVAEPEPAPLPVRKAPTPPPTKAPPPPPAPMPVPVKNPPMQPPTTAAAPTFTPGLPAHMSSPSVAAPGLPPAKPSVVASAPPGLLEPASNTPSPEGVQDFLNVLRRRKLPDELTEDKRTHFTTMVANCVLSLYRDRIRPVQTNVQRRLRERNCAESIVQALLPLCARESETYRILPPTGSRLPVILLIQEPKWFEGFVDTESPTGNYSGECWEALTNFLSDDTVALPSQPYQAALELRQLNLPHLQSLALGEVEHMVRLCMGKKRLMYHADFLKPGRVVRAMERDRRVVGKGDEDQKAKPTVAPAAKPEVSRKQAEAPAPAPVEILQEDIVDKDDLTVVLIQLMARFPDGVSLSQMKQHVQSQCKRNLNESAFKCSKLAEVFKLTPLSEIFPVEPAAGRNDMVVGPPNKNAIPNHIWQKYYHLKEHGGSPTQNGQGPAVTSGPPGLTR